MIDSHCHLDHEPMYSDLKNVILRSKESGVKKILTICTTKDSFNKITDIVESNLGSNSHGCSIKLTRGIKIIVAQIRIDPVTFSFFFLLIFSVKTQPIT